MKALRFVNADIETYKAYMWGEMDPNLLRLFVSFYMASNMFDRHNQDAVLIETKQRQKIAADKAKAKSKVKTR